jgi:hypothetical protein
LANVTACEYNEGDIMSDAQFYRLLAQSGVREFARGFYLEQEGIISEECFGDWMVETYNDLTSRMHEIVSDPMAVSAAEYGAWAADATELILGNKDKCSIGPLVDDYVSWCLEDEMRCFFGTDIEGRLVDHAVFVVTTAKDYIDIITGQADMCTDQQLIDEFGLISSEIGSVLAYTLGFNHKWGAVQGIEHISPSEYN